MIAQKDATEIDILTQAVCRLGTTPAHWSESVAIERSGRTVHRERAPLRERARCESVQRDRLLLDRFTAHACEQSSPPATCIARGDLLGGSSRQSVSGPFVRLLVCCGAASSFVPAGL